MMVFIFLLLAANRNFSQNTGAIKPCSTTEASQFDFWLGNWDLTWNDTSHGTNTILKIMDGCTINENFNSPSANYKGSSWSVYNPQSKKWQQTWVDNQGGYISLSGKFENNRMTLLTESQKSPTGKEIMYRMVYYNITPGKFDWKWESTTDSGATWKTIWLIHYLKKSS